MKVRDVIRMIESDGWRLHQQKGQYKHAAKKGRVTVAGHPNDDMAPKTLAAVFFQAQTPNRRGELK